jgi:hypothetical protein
MSLLPGRGSDNDMAPGRGAAARRPAARGSGRRDLRDQSPGALTRAGSLRALRAPPAHPSHPPWPGSLPRRARASDSRGFTAVAQPADGPAGRLGAFIRVPGRRAAESEPAAQRACPSAGGRCQCRVGGFAVAACAVPPPAAAAGRAGEVSEPGHGPAGRPGQAPDRLKTRRGACSAIAGACRRGTPPPSPPSRSRSRSPAAAAAPPRVSSFRVGGGAAAAVGNPRGSAHVPVGGTHADSAGVGPRSPARRPSHSHGLMGTFECIGPGDNTGHGRPVGSRPAKPQVKRW